RAVICELCANFALTSPGGAPSRPAHHQPCVGSESRAKHSGSIARSCSGLGTQPSWEVLSLLRRSQRSVHSSGVCRQSRGALEDLRSGQSSHRRLVSTDKITGSSSRCAGTAPCGTTTCQPLP